MVEVSSALTQAVQPNPVGSWCGSDTRTSCGLEVLTKTLSSFSRTSRLTSGGGSGGGGSPALARMNAGTGERLSAMPQSASTSASPAINATCTNVRRIARFYPVAVKITRDGGQFAPFGHQQLLKHTVTKRAFGAGIPIRCCHDPAAEEVGARDGVWRGGGCDGSTHRRRC